MKRDIDLVRKLLLEIERDPKLDGTHFQAGTAAGFDLDPAEYSDAEVAYHLTMLIEEGFVTGSKETPLVSSLTWKGHEFLDTVRDAEVWRLTKEGAKKAGVASVQLLWAIGTAVAKQKLAEHGIHL